MDTTITEPLTDCPAPSLPHPVESEKAGDSVLSQVIACLDNGLRLFAEGESEQACLCLAKANSLLESCLAGVNHEACTAPISMVEEMPLGAVEGEEESPLALAATA